MKKKFLLLFMLMFVFSFSVYANYLKSHFKLKVNSYGIYVDMFLMEGSNYVKLRDITDNTSLDVEWGIDEQNNSYVNIIDNSLMTFDSIILYEDTYYIDIAPLIYRYSEFSELGLDNNFDLPYPVSPREKWVGNDTSESRRYGIYASDNATKYTDLRISMKHKYFIDSPNGEGLYIDYNFFLTEIYPYYLDIMLENEEYIKENSI